MVINRSDLKRKRKDEDNSLLDDESPKRTKVHAQRKFAQGTIINTSPILTPIIELDKPEKSRCDNVPEPQQLLPMKRPHTEDFLTFLCFRGTSMLPQKLNFFSNAPSTDSNSEHGDSPISPPQKLPLPSCNIHNSESGKDRPFIAFGVRKRADPILISKQMDKKRRHALALQALRRKYQEQRMAKIRAITISQLSEKVTSKGLVRTRSVAKSETSIKKNVAQKTRVKVVSTKVTTTSTATKSPINLVQTQKKKTMCLRSFRGRFNHQELQVVKSKKRRPIQKSSSSEQLKSNKNDDKKCKDSESDSSEFSTDDEVPLSIDKSRKLSLRTAAKVPLHVIKKAIPKTASKVISSKITRNSTNSTSKSFSTRSQVLTRQNAEINKKLKSPIKQNSSYPILRRCTLIQRKELNKKTRNAMLRRKHNIMTKIKKESSGEDKESANKIQVRKCGMETRRTKIEVDEKRIKVKPEPLCNANKKDEVKIEEKLNKNEKNLENENFKNKDIKKNSVEKTTKKSDLNKSEETKKSKEESKVPQRPTRKTKEAAAIYMELLGHKLINERNVDDDNISIDSFPELPNVRRTEQRENELKLKAKTKAKPTAVKSNEKKISKKHETNEKKIEKTKIKRDKSTSSDLSAEKIKILNEKKVELGLKITKGNFLSDSEEMIESRTKTKPEKLKSMKTRLKSDTNDNFSDSGTDEKKKRIVPLSNCSKKNESFSDSDEQPLSKLTSKKDLVVSFNKTVTTKKEITEKPTYSKPKRECTKRPSNYLTMFSSSEEEDENYFGDFKSDGGKEIEKKQQEKKTNQVPASADLLCKDVDKRFGKGKVNMSTEQIEKWLKDSALAGSHFKKEEDEIIIKYEDKIPTDTSLNKDSQKVIDVKELKSALLSIDSNKIKAVCESNVDLDVMKSPSCKISASDLQRKTIFRKEKKMEKPNSNAFSPENESSVYAFEADTEELVKATPFRRPSRRPSSTTTSKSEDNEESKGSSKFRLPVAVKSEKTTLENFIEGECSEELFYVPVQPVRLGSIEPVVKRIKNNMFPPKFCDTKLLQKSNKNDEDLKYKVPSSPSASSSSSTKNCKRPAAKTIKTSIVSMSDFPTSGDSCAQIVEAPVFYPNDKEFQDPLEYIEKIRSKAEKFGICRIVPPNHFKPECKVSDEMRFTSYNQFVHKMLHRWGPNVKELVAIKKYLHTQSINLVHPPWIGGIEIDLPRLYQTVQTLGGLKEVIEKKKWPKVSELMRIPKSAQDRVTKLDDIYCKYLLPYDTLSPAEREKLFEEVETEWVKRESKLLEKSLENTDNDDVNDDESDQSEQESDDELDECIVKGRNMALNTFFRIARNTMSMWFKTTDPSAQEVEQEFWKHVNTRQNHICVHSGSIDSGSWGYGFAVSKNSPFARHAWNLKVLTNNAASILRSMGPVMGVTVPTLHVGMVFAGCCWYRDPHHLPWIEYLHTGGSKIWYGIPDSMSDLFRTTVTKLVPKYCHDKTIWLPSDTAMVPPNLLVENGVSLSRTVQEPGHYIVVFPKAFTSNLCTGYVVSESVYFAPVTWLNCAEKVFEDMKNSCEPSMFSLDRLILSIAADNRSNVDVLKLMINKVNEICQREITSRKKLKELGMIKLEKAPKPEAIGARKRKMQNDSDYECEICRTNLFVSWVIENQEDSIYCLEHAITNLEKNKTEYDNYKLIFTYSEEELKIIMKTTENNISNKLNRKLTK